ncbi:MAG TPA: hypothetical protein VF245_03100 [Solirubrobacterales bacterium]
MPHLTRGTFTPERDADDWLSVDDVEKVRKNATMAGEVIRRKTYNPRCTGVAMAADQGKALTCSTVAETRKNGCGKLPIPVSPWNELLRIQQIYLANEQTFATWETVATSEKNRSMLVAIVLEEMRPKQITVTKRDVDLGRHHWACSQA